MNVLFSNDRRNAFPPSWYADSVHPPPLRPMLKGETRADVAIVGAGFTGLSAALTLAGKGFDVVVLDAHRAGFGASGRNGGQVGSGFNKGQPELEKTLGKAKARALWDLAEEAKALTRHYCEAYAPDARFLPGVAHGAYSRAEVNALHREVDWVAANYGYDQAEALDAPAFQAIVQSATYKGGLIDRGAGHIHPLRLCLGLASAAEQAGARLFEGTHVHHIKEGANPVIQTDRGRVVANHVVLACNGYLGGLNRRVAARVMPINSFIAATKPLEDRAAKVLAQDIAVADSRFVVNYFRLSEDKRLLFGGRESYTLGFPKDITSKIAARVAAMFPQIADVPFTHAWGGTLGITMNRMPCVLRLAPNILSASGYSGHGVALSNFCGKLMGEAIAGQSERFDLMTEIPISPFPGGSAARSPLLTLAMTWYALRDRLGV